MKSETIVIIKRLELDDGTKGFDCETRVKKIDAPELIAVLQELEAKLIKGMAKDIIEILRR